VAQIEGHCKLLGDISCDHLREEFLSPTHITSFNMAFHYLLPESPKAKELLALTAGPIYKV
jgi:hypothetical protein